ncbi:MAG: hypothetical protein Q9181_006162 [Wetmoreana brouardii]
MSTFKGIITEFPDIRIDYFRTIAGRVPPLACFLSHVHSDHLQGLESLKSPFVYCSSVTRELLLRIEKYPHRMNFVKGILEARKLHYKHLRMLLKPIPVNVPTEIELKPGLSIRVTLLDANHCPGAVMFLIQDDRNAILYTGDIRAEPWWVHSIVQQPVLIPYTHGLRQLDKVYLDTTFATKEEPFRSFPTKAQGLSELLTELSKFPEDTIFHFNAWTLGYEEVWRALAAHLKSRIHVDNYKLRLYSSLATSSASTSTSSNGAALCGFQLGNRVHAGCLTNDESVRLHSCEHGTECSKLSTSRKVIWITPLINHSAEGDVPELGAGGGGGDLTQSHELELTDPETGQRLIELCENQIKDAKLLASTVDLIEAALVSGKKSVALDLQDVSLGENVIPLESLAQLLSNVVAQGISLHDRRGPLLPTSAPQGPSHRSFALGSKGNSTKHVRFPYSRHSSYDEMCHLLFVFRPKDVYPCVTDEENWSHDVSMRSLFSHLCSGTSFCYDEEMRAIQNLDQVPPVESNTQHRSSVRAESGGPEQLSGGPDVDVRPLRSLTARDRSTSAGDNLLCVGSNSMKPAKRRVSIETPPRKKNRRSIGKSIQEHSSREDNRAMVGSFLEWVELSDKVPLATKHTVPDDHISNLARDVTINATPPSTDAGTQSNPVKLSDSSGSETEAEVGNEGGMQGGAFTDEAANNGSTNETQLSLPDWVFESQEGSSSNNVLTTRESRIQSRIRYRKQVDKALRGDDGHVWGKDCGLLSTALGQDDDSEL